MKIDKISNKEYRQMEGISKSSLELFKKSPLHYKYSLENPKEDTPSLLFGRAAHKYILEKEDFFNEFVIAPDIDRRTKAGKEQWAEFIAGSEGKDVISVKDFEQIQEMDKAIDSVPLARQLLTGEHEVSYFWEDVPTGEMCKCRPDCLTTFEGKNLIVDYKTCVSCADGQFEKNVRKFNYKLQSFQYTEGLFNCELTEYGFAFVAQEKTAPYAVRVYFCDPEFIREGGDEFRVLMGIYHECKTKDEWPGYEMFLNTPVTLYPDDYVYGKNDDDDADDGEVEE